MENEVGSLSVGKYADFVILDQDIMTVPAGADPGDEGAADGAGREDGVRTAVNREQGTGNSEWEA